MSQGDYWRNSIPPEVREPSSFAVQVIKKYQFPSSAHILELGCGYGADTRFFLHQGCRVTAVDVNSFCLTTDLAEHSNLEFVKCDIAEYHYPENHFDMIYAHLSLHYFSAVKTKEVFKGIYRALKPSAYFCFKCKSTKDSACGKGKEVEKNMYDYNGHIRHFFDSDFCNELLSDFKILSLLETSNSYAGRDCSFIEVVAQKTTDLV